jgi:hypothetical protein
LFYIPAPLKRMNAESHHDPAVRYKLLKTEYMYGRGASTGIDFGFNGRYAKLRQLDPFPPTDNYCRPDSLFFHFSPLQIYDLNFASNLPTKVLQTEWL